MPAFFRPLSRNMLDLDDPDHARLRGLVHKVFTPKLVKNMRPCVESLTDELLNAARPHERMDLVREYAWPLPTASALAQAEEAGDKLNEDELVAMIFLLLVAGHETTVNLISNGTLALLRPPDQAEKLPRKPPWKSCCALKDHWRQLPNAKRWKMC